MKASDRVRAVAFFNEDLDLIDPIYTVYSTSRGIFDESCAVTVVIDDIPVASAGAHKVYKGVGILWAYIDKNIPKKFTGRVALIIKETLHYRMEREGFHRLQADVAVSLKAGHRFIKFMGLESEGIMKAFGPDKEDYIRYALVRC